MSSLITDHEWEMFRSLPEEELIALAVELDIVPPGRIESRDLIERCVLTIVERAPEDGLPFSKYDRADLEALPAEQLAAIARLQGVEPSVRAILKVGRSRLRALEKIKPGNPLALMLPMLLPAIARATLALGHAVDRPD